MDGDANLIEDNCLQEENEFEWTNLSDEGKETLFSDIHCAEAVPSIVSSIFPKVIDCKWWLFLNELAYICLRLFGHAKFIIDSQFAKE